MKASDKIPTPKELVEKEIRDYYADLDFKLDKFLAHKKPVIMGWEATIN